MPEVAPCTIWTCQTCLRWKRLDQQYYSGTKEAHIQAQRASEGNRFPSLARRACM